MTIVNLSGDETVGLLLSVAAAYVLALPLGWERKAKSQAYVGLRVFPLVSSLGSCGYLLIGRYLYERGVFDVNGQARALRAMMTGIGFIGGGAIFRSRSREQGVVGITTAASVWATGAIGALAAHGYYTVAVVLTVTSLIIVEVTGKLSVRSRAAAARDDAADESGERM